MGYVKFIIVSEERTGSTMLELLLASHERIICRGEILNPSAEVRRNALPHYKPLLKMNDDAIKYLDANLYSEVPEQVRAVGFRLMYSHAKTGAWKKARQRIVNDDDIRIIHLKRENLLARYLSHCLAERNGRWIATNVLPESQDEMIHLDVNECVKSFTESEWSQDETDRIFSAHQKSDVIYEKLSTDTDSEMRSLLQFLGVEYQQLRSPTRRQRSKKMREVIQNFEQLKGHFTNGIEEGWSKPKWQSFFDED